MLPPAVAEAGEPQPDFALQGYKAPLASAPLMNRIALVATFTLVLFATACERHPVGGDPPLAYHRPAGEKHDAAKPHEAAKPHDTAKPATTEKPAEAPKFFPEKQ